MGSAEDTLKNPLGLAQPAPTWPAKGSRAREREPVVLPLGVLEYHGEHMAVGMDTLAVTKMLDILEREAEIVILPPFYYGAASYAVEAPEGNGFDVRC